MKMLRLRYIDGKGNDILQYPADRTPVDVAKAITFGKSSLPKAKGWVDSGFKSLSAKETEEYQKAIARGETPTKAYDDIMAKKKEEAEKTKANDAFKERKAKEIPAFKFNSKIEELTKKYESEYGEKTSIAPVEKDREITHDNVKYTLTDDLLIERQKMYNQALERVYSSILSRPASTKQIVKYLEDARKTTEKLSDLDFWRTYEMQIRRTKFPRQKK